MNFQIEFLFETRNQASFDAVPPPWEWTPAWLHRLATMDVNAVRYLMVTGIRSARDIIKSMTDGESLCEEMIQSINMPLLS